MITVSFENNTQILNVKAAVTMDQLQLVRDALQAQVTEILTGPDNSPDQIRMLKEAAFEFGIDLDLSAATATELVAV
jgi:hypothetical protein